MTIPVAIALLAVSVALWSMKLKRERALTAELAELGERLRELQVRVEATEADVAHAMTQAEIAESVLLEKGVADEEDIENVRRRFGDDAPPASDATRGDGELH